MSTHVGIGELVRPLWPFTINRDSPQAQGLVRWWPLGYWPDHEFDMVANQQLTNTATVVQTDVKMRVRRDFPTSHTLKSSLAVLTSVPLSLAAWINLGTPFTTKGVLSLDDNSTSNQFSIRVNDTFIECRTNNSGATCSVAIGIGAWNHGLATFTSATSRAIFTNGVDKQTGTTDKTPSGINTTTVGEAPDGTQEFDGKLSDLRIYNRVLTDREAASYFSDPRLSLDLYYPLGRRTWSFPKKPTAATILASSFGTIF